MPNHLKEDAHHCRGKQNNFINVMQPDAIRRECESNLTNSGAICSRLLFLLTVQVKRRHSLRGKLFSPWHYQCIVHSLYSVSVTAREDIYPWMPSVRHISAESTWNRISIDLHWHPLSPRVLGQSTTHHATNLGNVQNLLLTLAFPWALLSRFHPHLLAQAIENLHG